MRLRRAQTFVLERLLRRDFLTVTRGCKLLASALNTKAVLEGFDFAGVYPERVHASLMWRGQGVQGTEGCWVA